MKKINYIGLDMDHTLIRYDSERFESLAHRVMLEKLVEQKEYPKEILDLEFDIKRAIRGLVIDKVGGNILKLSRHAAIRESYHGLEPISYKTQSKLYKSTYIDLSDPNFDTVDTSFSYSFATLFSQLVDLKDKKFVTELPDYFTIAGDLAFVLDQAHRDGSIKNVVRDNLDQFLIKDEEVVRGLEAYVKHGKKVFVATNSDYFYSKLLLDYCINPFLKDHKHWSELFEFVVTLAQKPRFFYDKLRFLKVNPEDGSMTNVDKIEAGGIYQGGCAEVLTSSLGLSPEEILYIGDHIYGDIVRLKKDCAWRTALVVEEIDQEIESREIAKPVGLKIDQLMQEKIPLESKVDELISKQILEGHKKHENEIKDLMAQVQKIDSEIGPLIGQQKEAFNPYWGEVFRTGIEESFFAYQVERFACIYMGRLSDLTNYSPRTYFRSSKRLLAHDEH